MKYSVDMEVDTSSKEQTQNEAPNLESEAQSSQKREEYPQHTPETKTKEDVQQIVLIPQTEKNLSQNTVPETPNALVSEIEKLIPPIHISPTQELVSQNIASIIEHISQTQEILASKVVETSLDQPQDVVNQNVVEQTSESAQIENKSKRKSINEEDDPNSTIHAFNASNITVIERKLNISNESEASNKQDGSDSGVEVCLNEGALQRALSSNSGGYASSYIEDPAQSCNSSLISCCSTFEDAYDLLARKNSTLLEDLKHQCDLTSENGSESSSVTGSNSSRPTKRLNPTGTKKKVALTEPVKSPRVFHLNTPIGSKPRPCQKSTPLRTLERSKSKERNMKMNTPRPSSLKTTNTPRPKCNDLKPEKAKLVRSTSTTRNPVKTPVVTPTDDGRWPSNRNTTMTRSFRGTSITSETTIKTRIPNDLKPSNDSKNTFDKYATLPRRRRERSADNIRDLQSSRDTSQNRTLRKQNSRENTPARTLPPYPKPKKAVLKTKIYHETSSQTCVTVEDINKAFAGIGITPLNPFDVETSDSWVQCDRRHEDVEVLETQLKNLMEKNHVLTLEAKEHKERMVELEQKLLLEKVEKKAIKDELEKNMQRVQTILGQSEEDDNDSLLVLESRFQKAGHVIIKQENEISELHSLCRSIKRDLEKSLVTQRFLVDQQHELEVETAELQEFMQAEKSTLSEALHEAELKLKSQQHNIVQRDGDLERQQDECKHLVRISEQRRQENLALQARLGALESRSRDLLLHQGAASSGASVALNGLISRIDVFVQQLITSYNISDKDLEDVIFHNEAYSNSNSSAEGSPEKSKRSPDDPKKGSTFVMAVISAIKNAAAQSPFAQSGKMNSEDRSDSTEMLDSETEPCLMMENVLEDVPIQDGYTHNMISSSHSLLKSGMLGRSESLHNLSQAILNRQISEQARLDGSLCESMQGSYSETLSLSEICPNLSLVDLVIDADNLITKLLKVLRIIQLESDTTICELQEERSELSEKLQKQRETNDQAAQQLKDWEVLGARLKSELGDVMLQLSAKNREIDDIRAALQMHRQQNERLNQDVCELSTACNKAELELKVMDDEALSILNKWEKNGEVPKDAVLAKLTARKNEMPGLKEKLSEKDKQLDELQLEFQASRQVMAENWNQAVTEARKQYEAIDTALETLHSIQTVVQQCPPLAKLQRDLEETNFHCASTMPYVSPDFNANAALFKQNLQQATPINSTA